MTDTNKIDEAAVPWARSLDEWHANNAVAADNKDAVLAADFLAERTARYLESEGRDQIGGFVQPSLGGSRMVDWLHMPRGTVWR
jgi:hypothetical protein